MVVNLSPETFKNNGYWNLMYLFLLIQTCVLNSLIKRNFISKNEAFLVLRGSTFECTTFIDYNAVNWMFINLIQRGVRVVLPRYVQIIPIWAPIGSFQSTMGHWRMSRSYKEPNSI